MIISKSYLRWVATKKIWNLKLVIIVNIVNADIDYNIPLERWRGKVPGQSSVNLIGDSELNE